MRTLFGQTKATSIRARVFNGRKLFCFFDGAKPDAHPSLSLTRTKYNQGKAAFGLKHIASELTPAEDDVQRDGARVGEQRQEDEVVQIEAFHQDPRVIGHDGEVPHAGQALARPVSLRIVQWMNASAQEVKSDFDNGTADRFVRVGERISGILLHLGDCTPDGKFSQQ